MEARTALFYGRSDTGKTSQLWFLARWIYKTFRKRTRLITADPGGSQSAGVDKLEGESMLESINLNDAAYRNKALGVVRLLSKGLWPQAIGGKMKLVATTDWESIGAYYIEGATSICDLWLGHIARQEEQIGPRGREGYGPFSELGELFSPNTDAQYGLVQTEMRDTCARFKGLPVQFVFWTAALGEGLFKQTGETVYCPAIAGQAKNAQSPGWFGDCLHFEDIMGKVKRATGEVSEEKVVRAWFQNHVNPDTQYRYLSKLRLIPPAHHALRERYPKGYVVLTIDQGIDRLYQFLLDLEEEA